MKKITDLARGHWPSILGTLAGLSAEQLTDKHQSCPLCGGKDRYRFDDKDGNGSWFCNKCGGKNHTGGAGNGMDMLMRKTGMEFADAARKIEAHLGIVQDRPQPPTANAEHTWIYNDNFVVARFSGKRYRPFAFDGNQWKPGVPPGLRPLLNLGKIRATTGTVIICEGEKACDAAARLFPRYTATTWSSGCKAYNKSDFSPLIGRKIVLWPDADEPGQQAMEQVAVKLQELGVKDIRIVTPPSNVEQGWDLADASWTSRSRPLLISKPISQNRQHHPSWSLHRSLIQSQKSHNLSKSDRSSHISVMTPMAGTFSPTARVRSHA